MMKSSDVNNNDFKEFVKNIKDTETGELTDELMIELSEILVKKNSKSKKLNQSPTPSCSNSEARSSKLKKRHISLAGKKLKHSHNTNVEAIAHNAVAQNSKQKISFWKQPLKNTNNNSIENESTETSRMIIRNFQGTVSPNDDSVSIENGGETAVANVNQRLPTQQLFLKMIKLSTPFFIERIADIFNFSIETRLINALNDKTSHNISLLRSTRGLFLAFSGVISITTNLTVQAQSANRFKEVGVIYRQSQLLSLLFSIPSVILCIYVKPLLVGLSIEPESAEACENFFHYFLISVPAFFMLLSVEHSLCGLKKQFLIAGIKLINVPIFYLLGHSLAAPDRLGARGLAITHALSWWGLLATFHLYILFSTDLRKNEFFTLTNLQNEMKEFRRIIKLGLPIVANSFIFTAQHFILDLFVSWLGGNAQTIKNVSLEYVFYAIFIPYLLARSSSILISNALGEKRYNDVRRIGHIHVAAGTLTVTSISCLAFVLIPQLINQLIPVGVRGDNEEELYNTVKTIIAINSVEALLIHCVLF